MYPYTMTNVSLCYMPIKSWVWKSENSLLNRAKRGEVPGLEGLEIDESDGNAGSVKVILSGVKPVGVSTE